MWEEEVEEHGDGLTARDVREAVRAKRPGEVTVGEAIEAGAPAIRVPERTPEQKAYYELFPYLNGLLKLDPVAVANASPDVEGASQAKALFEDVLPWFERFFEALGKQRQAKIRAVESKPEDPR